MIKNLFAGIKNKTRLNQRAVVFLTCILISVGFWFITSMSRVYETVITIPVSYRNLPFTKHVDGELPSQIDFHFRGTGFELFGLHLRKHTDSLKVDLSSAMDKNGQINIPSASLKKQFRTNPEPFRISPERITPGLSSRKGKRVPVELQSEIVFRDRFRPSGKIILRPDSIDIAGPEELLAKVQSVKTEKLLLNDIHGDYFGGINLAEPEHKGIQYSQPYIHYFIPVVEYTEGIAEVPVELPVSLQNKVTLIPSRVRITYQVELNRYSEISADDFLVFAELPPSDLPASLEVKIKRMPAKLLHVRIQPQFVDYLIKE